MIMLSKDSLPKVPLCLETVQTCFSGCNRRFRKMLSISILTQLKESLSSSGDLNFTAQKTMKGFRGIPRSLLSVACTTPLSHGYMSPRPLSKCQ